MSQAVITDTSRSQYACLRPAPLTQVTLDDGFWSPRLQINREITLPTQYHHLEQTGRIDNFRRAAGKQAGPFRGYFFNDSDVYKWVEAVAWTLAARPDPALEQMIDTVITEIAAAQQPDGYLNTYFTFERAAERWSNLRDMHELYCAGHLIQAAIAHYRSTGSRRLLDVARRLANHICAVFDERPATCGHPQIEMALVELTRVTANAQYLEQARRFLDARGHGLIGGSVYHLDHQPFCRLEQLAGHAVRAMYLCAGAADIYAETGDTALRDTLERLWRAMTACQMYLTGGVGARHEGESCGAAYELPNARAYAETCAAIGNVFWNWRMLALDGDARYADVMELALYNGVLAGVSLDGQAYFYENPLAGDGTQRRQPWFECACCPPNIARLLAALPGYLYSVSDQGVWVHLYAAGAVSLDLPDGQTARLRLHTRYPWDGEITIEVEGQGSWGLFLRIPGWCEGSALLEINGRLFEGELVPGAYVQVRRNWRHGDYIRLVLPMPVRRIQCHPYVTENVGRIALMRGPLVYCVEQVDHPAVDVRDLVLLPEDVLSPQFAPGLLGGVVILRGQAHSAPPDDGWAGRLYRTALPSTRRPGQSVELTAIPYYAWANRAPGAMQVWLESP